jgi:hypothetical protein
VADSSLFWDSSGEIVANYAAHGEQAIQLNNVQLTTLKKVVELCTKESQASGHQPSETRQTMEEMLIFLRRDQQFMSLTTVSSMKADLVEQDLEYHPEINGAGYSGYLGKSWGRKKGTMLLEE